MVKMVKMVQAWSKWSKWYKHGQNGQKGKPMVKNASRGLEVEGIKTGQRGGDCMSERLSNRGRILFKAG
jgi:hypothetical protein